MNYLENMLNHNKILSKYACPDSDAIYLHENKDDFRTPFFRDIDRIIYTLAFVRYSDKTQVFSFKENDHLTKRMIHIQYVAKIARTIGRALGLNEDLIEAASLGHDLGHTPFGHVGEAILNEISLENNEGYFNHNVHSVRLLMYIENYGKGLNITLQTLDAIMCHNGEFASQMYEVKKKSKEEFLKEYESCYKDRSAIKKLRPMTLEGAVVRISDLIAYLGRDIEDAKRMGLIDFSDIPLNIKENLGTSNREIVNTIVMDIINNSIGKDYIKLSDNVFKSIVELKKFNYENIYYKAYTNEEKDKLKLMLNTLFNKYMKDLENNNTDSNIIKSFLANMSDEYKNNNSNARIVIDYIAGMTDDYTLREYNNYLNLAHTKFE
ncbi:MAG TPA: HD domain-containing protein [Candidatus Onthocola stercorigallinarum]|nr:HD domain-containing protein [Candidatus Onthocola stercorigallinarum]